MVVQPSAPQPEPQPNPSADYDISDEYRPEPPPAPRPPAWMDGSIRIGIHTSIAGSIIDSLDRAYDLGCNTLQIFSASPRMWPGRGQTRVAAPVGERFRERRAVLGLGPLVVHDNYLINLASPDRVLRTRSIQAFHDEIVRATAMGADFLVAHPGSSRGAGLAKGVEEAAQALRQVARGIQWKGLRVLLENTAGQGSALGSRFTELKAILEACPELPLGVCIDTAHMFAAGYDIRTESGLEIVLAEIERTVGLARVEVVHVNDSKASFGSRVDRHEHIGRGRIGLEAFRRILNHPLLAPRGAEGGCRAFILETPIDKPGDDRRNVRTLWKLVGVRSRPEGVPRVRDGFPQRRQQGRARRANGRRRR